MMDILEKINGIAWITLCFAALYFGWHLMGRPWLN